MKKIQYMKPRTSRVNIQNDYLLQATSGGLTRSTNLGNGDIFDGNRSGNTGGALIRNGFQDFN